MANMIDYIKENSNKTFEELPLTNVDNLILSTLTYLDFSECNYNIGLTLRDYYIDTNIKDDFEDVYFSKDSALKLIKYLAYSKRFCDIKLFNYIEDFSSEEIYQFSATTFCLPDGKLFVGFRGTDDKIESWHEDFLLAYTCPIISQYLAYKYLETVLDSFDKEVYVGGHSKGGNLAVYSAMMTDLKKQNKILKVFNNDGPGFPYLILNSKRYSIIKEKIINIVPKSSIVGMVLSHTDDYLVVKSNEFMIMQHDPISWQVSKEDFDYTTISNESIVFDKSISNWLISMTEEEKKEFVEILFRILSSNEMNSVNFIRKNPLKQIKILVSNSQKISSENKQIMRKVLSRLIREIIENSSNKK